ncbi:hypothetical protein KGF56_003760 [Candida oxycetoniae]|uniref:Proteasome assembly chaperone 2 n=1 Tax=Candida oxycetoniae TaxID=497107 RepID=A0AAI9WWP9_9ASCO|nr:uncharacterized protein KGF56_003760 [Candida oxycetoniae]KAI3403476.2 hypothetical protein KGF56_003760 [Candida oxycetoniae]
MSLSYTPLRSVPQPDIRGSILIIPSISIGNIPQLSVDLLIHSYNFTKIGYLNDLYLYPFASPIDYVSTPSNEGIAHAIEVYYSSPLNTTLIQQRSPIAPTYTEPFVNETIVPFIKSNNFQKIVILNSSDAGLAEGVSSGDIKYYEAEDLITADFERLTISKNYEVVDNSQQTPNSKFVSFLLEAFDLPNAKSQSQQSQQQQSQQSQQLQSQSSGLSEQQLKDRNVALLMSYVYEGDNFQDAEKMTIKLKDILNLLPQEDTKLIKPVSWQGAYGDKSVPNAMEEGIFG